MKKKIIIIVGVIVLLILSVVGYYVISDLNQESKLKNELNELSDLVNADNINMDEINQRLNRTVTKNDYAVVEKSFKNYLKDSFDNSLKIAQVLNDEQITTLLTVDNYQNDGKDFIKTKKYIADTKNTLEECQQKYNEYLTKEKAMSYINDKGLDSYYTTLYENELIGDLSSENEDKTVENAINDIIDILNATDQVITFLSNNSNDWEIENNNIVFSNENLTNEYNQLISSVL